MRRLLFVPVALIVLAVPAVVLAGSGDGGFDAIVHSIESRYHVRATHIPFMGLISFASRKATHGGVMGLHVAEFESFTEAVDGDELNRMVESKLGPGWERIVRSTSKSGHEQTLIFLHPEGDKMGMMVVDLDGKEMNVVEMAVDPKHLDDDMGQYTHHHHDDNTDTQDGKDAGGASN
jgi:hypothetical protein